MLSLRFARLNTKLNCNAVRHVEWLLLLIYYTWPNHCITYKMGFGEARWQMKKLEWEEPAARGSSRQESRGCITMRVSVQYSQPACWDVGVGDCGTMRTRRVLLGNDYTRESCCHDKREMERLEWWWKGSLRSTRKQCLYVCRARTKRQ